MSRALLPTAMYAVKEIFYSLQGEGFHAGRPAIFCRFAGCNLWSGREVDRATAACAFCDTDFVGTDGSGGGKFPSAEALASAIASRWPTSHAGAGFVVFTGGEPLLQLDAGLLSAMRLRGFFCAVETNGTLTPPNGLDWITVSPKRTSALATVRADEVKLVFPQDNVQPEDALQIPADHYFLQPMDNAHRAENQARAVEHCLRDPRWRLSLQTHKYLGIL